MSYFRQFAWPFIVGSAVVFATPAIAQDIVVTSKKVPEGFEPVQKVVKIGDLNLATTAGVAEMEKRVSQAVNSICRAPVGAPYWEERDSKMCRDFAWESARPQMDRAIRKAPGS